MEEHKAGGWEWGPGYSWRAAVSFASFFGLLIFVVVWLFFSADAFTIYQNIAIVIAAVLVSFGIIGATWATMWMGASPPPVKR